MKNEEHVSTKIFNRLRTWLWWPYVRLYMRLTGESYFYMRGRVRTLDKRTRTNQESLDKLFSMYDHLPELYDLTPCQEINPPEGLDHKQTEQ